MKFLSLILALFLVGAGYTDSQAQDSSIFDWPIHDMDRPAPPQVEPGLCSATDVPVPPPADAVVLFGKDDLSAWQHADSSAAKWMIDGNVFQVVKGTGGIHTKENMIIRPILTGKPLHSTDKLLR